MRPDPFLCQLMPPFYGRLGFICHADWGVTKGYLALIGCNVLSFLISIMVLGKLFEVVYGIFFYVLPLVESMYDQLRYLIGD